MLFSVLVVDEEPKQKDKDAFSSVSTFVRYCCSAEQAEVSDSSLTFSSPAESLGHPELHLGWNLQRNKNSPGLLQHVQHSLETSVEDKATACSAGQ